MTIKQVLNDYILVRPVAEKADDGMNLEIPDSVDKERPTKGIVVIGGTCYVGDSKSRQIDVAAGDKVLFEPGFTGSNKEIEQDGEKLLLIPVDNLLAIYD